MHLKQLPIFKDLTPYSGQIDRDNRWIKLAELVPWDAMDKLYRRHFDEGKQSVIKSSRLILGLMLGQMLLKLGDRPIVEYFHENPYFQYFCGQDTFVVKTEKSILHHSLLSKRRKRLGKAYMAQFEQEVLGVLKEKGLIKGKTLMLDATVFPAHITYPNDVKLLNTVREYLCQTILDVKNTIDPTARIRTYRKTARRLYLTFQKTRRKSRQLIRTTRNKMIRFVRRNIDQLEQTLEQATTLKTWQKEQIKAKLSVAKDILAQQTHLATTRGRQVANRIVSFHWPQVRPLVRGKEGKTVEFGPKAHIALVDGYACLDHVQYGAFHEGNQLDTSLTHHVNRFDRQPDVVLADQLYATRKNRALLEEKDIDHSFRRLGRPPNDSKEERQKKQRDFKTKQGRRNHVEACFGHLKSRFNLDTITWRVPDGETMQIHLGLAAFNLQAALAKA
ncbi:MAG: IS5 family transposase [Alphaproteobacteria bacterium]|nr:IS5 family transposase [Alphaproteobacteria bacterium]